MPFDLGHHAVAGHAGHIVNNGNALPRDTVEKRRFADIRAAYNGDES